MMTFAEQITSTVPTSFLVKAGALAECGIPVFPCKPTKAPYTRRGFRDATTDVEQITAWDRQYPDALVGMPTGDTVFVLDIDQGHADGADGFATLEQHGWSLPPTRTHTTKTGGAHLFFRVPEGVTIRSSAGTIGPGLDGRGEGGYVIRWDAEGFPVDTPDVVADIPDWLIARLEDIGSIIRLDGSLDAAPAIAALPDVIAAASNDDLGAGPLGLSMEEIDDTLSHLDPDMGYSDWVRVGQAVHHETSGAVVGLEAWRLWSARSAKYPGPDALSAKWGSFGNSSGAA